MKTKVTVELLHECANMYDIDTSYDIDSIMKDLNINTETNNSEYLYPISIILGTIADSISEYYVDKHEALSDKYMELALDKNSEPIHVGDIVNNKDGVLYRVSGISEGSLNIFLSKLHEDKDCAKPYHAQNFVKTVFDSYERIIEDAFAEGMNLIVEAPEDIVLKQNRVKDELIARCHKLAGKTDK